MAELRHTLSMGIRVSSSPVSPSAPTIAAALLKKRDDIVDDTVPLVSPAAERHRHRHRSFLHPESISSYKNIFIAVLTLLAFAAIFSVPSILTRLNAPYLCTKEGIVLRCPRVKEAPSLWENPYSSTTSWKPCAERHENAISDLPPENETSGYIFIHAEGGLNQQRIAICNAVAAAKIMNATLILPVLKQDQIWKDQSKLEDIFDVDHFIKYLKDDVRIVRDIPDWFEDKSELFTSIRRTVKTFQNTLQHSFILIMYFQESKRRK